MKTRIIQVQLSLWQRAIRQALAVIAKIGHMISRLLVLVVLGWILLNGMILGTVSGVKSLVVIGRLAGYVMSDRLRKALHQWPGNHTTPLAKR